jgi:hypothetical protein
MQRRERVSQRHRLVRFDAAIRKTQLDIKGDQPVEPMTTKKHAKTPHLGPELVERALPGDR